MTARLAQTVVDNWMEIDGYAAAHGMPELSKLSLERFCSFVWYMITRNADEAETRKLKARLWRPPVGIEPPKESPWSPENEQAAFRAFKSAVGQKGTAG